MAAAASGEPSGEALHRLRSVLRLGLPYWWTARVAEKLVARADGWDKVCKCLQYTGRVLVWAAGARLPEAHPLRARVLKPYVEPLVGHLSRARKVVRLGKWTYAYPALLEDVESLRNPEESRALSAASLLNDALALLTDFSDDVVWLGGARLVSKTRAEWWEELGARCWLVTCFFDIYFSARGVREVEEEIAAAPPDADTRELRAKLTLARVTLLKYVGDLGAALVQNFEPALPLGVEWSCALVSGLCSTYKLWVKASKEVVKEDAARAKR